MRDVREAGHRITAIVDGRPVETLEDLAPRPGGLLFVGLNPSTASVEAGHYHQGAHGRRFWARLAEASILPPGVDPETADDALVTAGHGMTDLLKIPTEHRTLTPLELRMGVAPLFQRVALWRPGAVVFIEQRAAEAAAGRPVGEAWGRLEGVALGGRSCFLMPGLYASAEDVDAGLNFLRNLGEAVRPSR